MCIIFVMGKECFLPDLGVYRCNLLFGKIITHFETAAPAIK